MGIPVDSDRPKTALKASDHYTYLHSVAVAAFMMNLARHLNFRSDAVSEFGLAGLLHDVGKISMPPELLNKTGALTQEEFTTIRGHPEAGLRTLQAGIDVPDLALDVCLHHHERMDGTGYPFGIQAARLSLAARMGAICDVYDALTSDRPYKLAWSPQRALHEMLSWEGHFDPETMRAFVNSVGIFPRGSLVRVRDISLGVVIADNEAEPTKPTVRTFYSIPGRRRLAIEDVKFAHDNVLSLEDPNEWDLEGWPSLRDRLLNG